MITLLKSPLKNSANNIVASPQTRMVKALDFDKKSEYKKFVKWIDSSTKDLEKIKIPSKKEIKKLEKLVLEMDGGGGGGLGGLLGLIPSILFPSFGGPDIPFFRRPKPPKGGKNKDKTKGGGPKVPRFNPKSLSRINDSFSRYISGKSNFGDRLRLFKGGRIGLPGLFTKGGFNAQGALKGQGFKLPGFGGGKPQAGGIPNLGSLGKTGSFLKNAGGVARQASGPLSLLFGVMDYSERKSEGQTETQAISGASSTAVGGAAAGAATGTLATAIALTVIPEPSSTVAGLIMLGSLAAAGVASYFGGKAAGNLSDKITGVNKENRNIVEENKKRENQFSSVLKTFGEAVDGLLSFAQNSSKTKEDYVGGSANSLQSLQNTISPETGDPSTHGLKEYDPNKKYKTGDTVIKDGVAKTFDGQGWALDQRSKLERDILAFRQARTKFGVSGNRVATDTTFNLAVRELRGTSGGSSINPLADDLSYQDVHRGQAHKEGYGFDIPVANQDQAAFVINFFRSRGYETIFGADDPSGTHDNHVHVQAPHAKAREFLRTQALGAQKVQPSVGVRGQVPASQASGRQQTVIITQGQGGGPQVIPQQIPIPIPMGGGGGGVAVASIPEVVLLNSLWNTLLLTKLSST